MSSQAPNPHSPGRRPGRPRHDETAESDVRDRLLDAATELAVEQGFEACGLRDIARRAGVSPGMIAYYFGDRRGLYEAMFARAFDRISEKVRAVMSDPDRSGEDRLDELVHVHVTAVAADPWLPRLVMREVLARTESPMQNSVRELMAKGPMDLMVDWLRESQARGEIRCDYDPQMLAMTIMSLTGFPFLMIPIVGDQLGLQLDDGFPDRLIEHNKKLLGHALRARTEEER